ncbi:MAG TPA: acetamidase/formamidase family protein [Xanthobacteraceae bacterium]|jgi:acetamidase/formamidase|nr:acetamidase/formamidase family protein [Xanthobacteraceae bacterium]
MSKQHSLPAGVKTVHRGYFAATIKPVLTIESGDTVAITTLSGNDEDLPPANAGFTVLPEHREVLAQVPKGEGPHLMTGPIAIKGAEPGDALAVEIVDIAPLQDWGWNLIKPGWGALPDHFDKVRRMHVPIDRERGVVTMPWGLKLKTAPFFGIIGVAPPPDQGKQTSVIPRAFGGNIDNKHLGKGATLHLPVFNTGGLLSAGDGHALQGDGEVCVTAIETGLEATLRVTLTKHAQIKQPWAETPSHVITMAFDPDLDAAAQSALLQMIKLIEQRAGLSAEDAYTLCSIAADVHVTQLVNVHKGIHVLLPKTALARVM